MQRGLFWAAFLAAFSAVTLPLLYLAAGLVGGVAITGGPRMDAGILNGAREYRVGLVAGPIHYDLLIPLHNDIRPLFGFALAADVPLDRAEWVLIGWGARGFYTQTPGLADITPAVALRAAIGDTAVMRLEAVGRIDDFAAIPLIALTQTEMYALLDAVLGSLDGTQALPQFGFTGRDAFFPARGRFHVLNTCNVWLGDMLRAAGLPFGRWTPFAQSIRLSLDRTGLARD
jgi:uncharacterized protein (TIGR02117 family)